MRYILLGYFWQILQHFSRSKKPTFLPPQQTWSPQIKLYRLKKYKNAKLLLPKFTAHGTPNIFQQNFPSKQTRSEPKACSQSHRNNPFKNYYYSFECFISPKDKLEDKMFSRLEKLPQNLLQDVIAMKSQIALTKQEEESSNIYCNLQFV